MSISKSPTRSQIHDHSNAHVAVRYNNFSVMGDGEFFDILFFFFFFSLFLPVDLSFSFYHFIYEGVNYLPTRIKNVHGHYIIPLNANMSLSCYSDVVLRYSDTLLAHIAAQTRLAIAITCHNYVCTGNSAIGQGFANVKL